jgi:hypothetical protein
MIDEGHDVGKQFQPPSPMWLPAHRPTRKARPCLGSPVAGEYNNGDKRREGIMTSIELTSKVDASGVLNLCIPLGTAEAFREVRVIVEPLDKVMSDEQWRQFVCETAGSITDPTFQRHPQGEFERREELFS